MSASAQATFDAMDANHDGVIDRREFAAAMQGQPAMTYAAPPPPMPQEPVAYAQPTMNLAPPLLKSQPLSAVMTSTIAPSLAPVSTGVLTAPPVYVQSSSTAPPAMAPTMSLAAPVFAAASLPVLTAPPVYTHSSSSPAPPPATSTSGSISAPVVTTSGSVSAPVAPTTASVVMPADISIPGFAPAPMQPGIPQGYVMLPPTYSTAPPVYRERATPVQTMLAVPAPTMGASPQYLTEPVVAPTSTMLPPTITTAAPQYVAAPIATMAAPQYVPSPAPVAEPAPAMVYVAPQPTTTMLPPTITTAAPQYVTPPSPVAASVPTVITAQPQYLSGVAPAPSSYLTAPPVYVHQHWAAPHGSVPMEPVAAAPMDAFDQMDFNHDGVIDRAEFAAATGQQ